MGVERVGRLGEMELKLKEEVEVGMEMELARSVRLLVVVASMSPISHLPSTTMLSLIPLLNDW